MARIIAAAIPCRALLLLLALPLFAPLAACDAPEPAGAATGERDTLPNGAERVRYGDLLPGPPDPVLPKLTIGTLEGEEPFIFGRIRGIEIGTDGAIYVLDQQASELRAFDPDGSFRGYVARGGEGPGEIVRANGVVRAPDGSLWVQDHGRWQLLRLEPDGGEIERLDMPVRQFGAFWGGVVDGEGRLWTRWRRSLEPSAPAQPPELGPNERESEESIVVLDPGTNRQDTIPIRRYVSRAYVMELQGGTGFRSIPFWGWPLMAVDPAGAVWSAMSDEYRIARLDAAGDTTLVIEVDHVPEPVTSDDRRTYVDAAHERGEEEARIARAISEEMPEHKPVLSGLVVDDEGRLWVRRFAEDDEPPAHFDVFTREGRYAGSMRLGFRTPSTFAPRIRDGRLHILAMDELDVESVVRVEVQLTGSPGG